MTDNESQDSMSMDETFFLVNVDPKLKTSNAYQNLMQEVLIESQERNPTPTHDEVYKDASENLKLGYSFYTDVCFLGKTVIQKANDPAEVNGCISDFSKQNRLVCSVSLLVPFFNNDCVKMIDPENGAILASFPIFRIGFCTSGYRGQFGDYLAFSFLESQNAESVKKDGMNVLQCYIFKMKSSFFTDRILESFRRAFDTTGTSMTNLKNHISTHVKTIAVKFKLTIDVKEEDGRGSYFSVPKEDGQMFKLRSNVKKKVFIRLDQLNGPMSLRIERCVGLFIGAGRFINDTDMILLEMDSLGESNNKSDSFSISGDWNPCDKGFELLNTVREKEQFIYMTIGINFCVQEIEAPLCLKIVCRSKIYSEFQRFWLNLKKSTILHLMLSLEEMVDAEKNQILIGKYVTKTIQYIWPDNIITVNCQPNIEGSITESIESDSEEPIKSGGGVVSKEITDEQLMVRWGALLAEWQSDIRTRPKGLNDLVKHGIPEALRGEVWQLMASCVSKETELQDVYRILITKETRFDAVIKRDMPRTFTAHHMFIQKDGPGQESLFRVCRAYAMYDEEVGYCQGSAFLAAALIIHMPEEQAFTLLVTIMHSYKVRDMYRNNFEGLHICLYQLDHLMAEKLSDLYQHFTELQLESHMYANQWFMTLFTMKFHLYAVFHILDLFLCDGMIVIFKVAMALLKLSRKELLAVDFEGALNYFRITLPKLYRNEEACKELIRTAISMKISNNKLIRLEKEWRKIQEVRAETEDPLETLQKELKKTKDEYNRLDQENDSLAKELMSSKFSMQKTIEKLEEKLDVVNKELFTTRKDFVDSTDQTQELQDELKKVKDKFREEVQIREDKLKQQEGIIIEYKKIASQLSERAEIAENVQCNSENCRKDINIIKHLEKIISDCSDCKVKALDEVNDVSGSDKTDDPSEIICLRKLDYIRQRDQVYETELMLANTKLSLVESNCQQQNLLHEVNHLKSIVAEQKEVIESSKGSIMKKILNLRDTKSDSMRQTKQEMRHSFCQVDGSESLNPKFVHSLSQELS